MEGSPGLGPFCLHYRIAILLTMRALLLVTTALVLASSARAQQASPYLPLDHWTMPYLEHLVRARTIRDPSPLIRPFRRADAREVLRAADTVNASGAIRSLVRRLATYFATDRNTEIWYRTDLMFGGRAATHARRTAVRDSGNGDLWNRGHLSGVGVVGPVAFASRLDWDYRLEADPDYQGSISREVAIPNRFNDAYGSVQFRLGEVYFGQMDRNWGPTFVEGVILSPSPYSYDHFAVRFGTRHASVSVLATQFDDLPNGAGNNAQRYLVLHNIYLRLPFHLTANIWEGTLFAGENRQFEPWFLNPFKLANRTWRDEGGLPNNNLVGGDFELAIPHWPRAYFSVFIDDFPPAAGDEEPTSGALTAGVQGAMHGVVWTAFYTAVANLTYRATSPEEILTRRGVGIGRNQSDYDQFTVRLSMMPVAGVLLNPEFTFIRQGEGDFRQPFPPQSAFPNTPVLHSGVVEKILRIGIDGRVEVPLGPASVAIAFDAAYHRFTNFGHIRGATGDRFVGSVQADFIVGWSHLLWEP